MKPPHTSISLLDTISSNTASSRWMEFYSLYEPVMRSYLAAHYPGTDHADIIQESMAALVKVLPNYTYSPNDKGHFSSYLIGIVKNKARSFRRKSIKNEKLFRPYEENMDVPFDEQNEKECKELQISALEIALKQILENKTISSRDREIFRCLVLQQEKPELVAKRYGITRQNVDVIKHRMKKELESLTKKMFELL